MRSLSSLISTEQRILQIRPIDDLLFNLMYQDKAACQELIRTILEDDSLIVLNVTAQDTVPNLLGRGVRLDVTCQTADGRMINVEVQRFDRDDHFRRIRYNSSVLTARHTPKGTDFRDVAEVYIIFITEFDIIKSEKTVCHIKSFIEETGEIIEDGLHRIIVNTAKYDGTKPARLMKHFRENYFEDNEFPESSRQIRHFKRTEKGRDKMGTVMQSIINDYVKEYTEYRDALMLIRNIETIADSIQGSEQDACRILKVSYEDYLNAKKLLDGIPSEELDEVFA